MSNEMPGYYAILIPQVRYDKNLKPMEKLLYAEITALSNKHGYCHASNNYFAELYDCDKATISRYISDLEKFGYVKVEIIRDSNNAVTERKIFISVDFSINPIDGKINRSIDNSINSPIDEKVKENITRLNTTSINKLPAGKKSKSDLFDAISEYTSNETLKKLLNGFLSALLKNTKGYTLDQWKIQLDNLKKYSCGNEQKAIEKVSNAFSAGYKQLVYPNELNATNSKPSFGSVMAQKEANWTATEAELDLIREGY